VTRSRPHSGTDKKFLIFRYPVLGIRNLVSDIKIKELSLKENPAGTKDVELVKNLPRN